jgi:UMF1 family MFS transporter
MTTGAIAQREATYRKRINAWVLYDWANSAFATTILAAVLPVYYSTVAGATLPSEATATAYWSIGLSISLFISAILSPILGTISDVVRGKKRFLAFFTGIGVVGTGLLVLIERGDWLLASAIFIVGRIGFIGAITFYDSLLPHVAKPDDQDAVSARGYAMGYLGGGILLALNVVMLKVFPGTLGARLSFLSVAIWWAVFSIPLFRNVPEPASATARLKRGETVVGVSLARLRNTLRDIKRYRHLFQYLIAFLVYNDAIGTIIGLAAIYGAELGFGSVELILALLLVQFVGIPFSLMFGSLPNKNNPRRSFFLAFILFNLIALPLVAIGARFLLPATISGVPSPAYALNAPDAGHLLTVQSDAFTRTGDWTIATATDVEEFSEANVFSTSNIAGSTLELPFHGQKVEIVYALVPGGGVWTADIDGEPVLEDGEPFSLDTDAETVRYGLVQDFAAAEPGDHVLTLTHVSGGPVSFVAAELPDIRQANLGITLALIFGVQVVSLLFAWTVGKHLVARLADTLDTRRSILLSLLIYIVVAIWGYFLQANVEFWGLAWMIAMVQGGSQALSRSLYASMSPAAKSGEFFGFYGIMEKAASIIGPLIFALAVVFLGSSRPAVLSLVVFFVLGAYLLTRVNIAEGRRVAQEEDAALHASTEH